jgi:hypothetical protein
MPDEFCARGADGLHEVLYLPAGVNTITPVKGPKKVAVLVEPGTAATMEAHRKAVEETSGKRTYFDFRHEDREASFWPKEFTWRDGQRPGVYARGEFSAAGRQGVEGKMWREFSPRCWLDNPNGTEENPAHVIVYPNAKPNLGGFVNDGAFDGVALWAGRGDSREKAQNTQNHLTGQSGAGTEDNKVNEDMRKTEQELAALKANLTTLQNEIQALKGAVNANAADELAKARLLAKENEARAVQAEIQAANAAEQAEKAQAEIKSRNQALAKVAIEAAKKRGAIPTQGPKAAEIEAKYTDLITSDPSNAVLLETLPGNEIVGARLTSGQAAGGSRIEGGFSAPAALKRYAEIVARNTRRTGPGQKFTQQTAEEMRGVAIEAANFYNEELDPHFNKFADMPVNEIMAATDADSLGTLAGVLVLQRSLPLFTYDFPVLSSLYTDFSATPGLYNQTENTRVIVAPAVQTYDPTTGTDGRPNGWKTVQAAQSTDVPIKLDTYVGVPIVFGQATISATIRRLFDEQGPAAIYAMAKYYVAKITALMTAGNFNAYAVATQDGKVPDAYPTYAVAVKDFSMDAIDDLEAIFDANEVPTTDRCLCLNAKYHGKLRKDPRLGLFFAAMQKPDMVTEGRLPNLNGFMPHRAPWLPSANNLVGFACHKAGIVLKQRLPTDFTQALNVMVPGSVTTLTDPKSGLSCLLVQYISLQGNYAEWRLEALLGAGVGDKRGGLCLTSQAVAQ